MGSLDQRGLMLIETRRPAWQFWWLEWKMGGWGGRRCQNVQVRGQGKSCIYMHYIILSHSLCRICLQLHKTSDLETICLSLPGPGLVDNCFKISDKQGMQ